MSGFALKSVEKKKFLGLILIAPLVLTAAILTLVSLPSSPQFKSKSVLSKYDEEIEGEKKKSFRLNAGGGATGDRERELQAMREMLRGQAQSLVTPVLTVASEFYTPQEMVSLLVCCVSHTDALNLCALCSFVVILGFAGGAALTQRKS